MAILIKRKLLFQQIYDLTIETEVNEREIRSRKEGIKKNIALQFLSMYAGF